MGSFCLYCRSVCLSQNIADACNSSSINMGNHLFNWYINNTEIHDRSPCLAIKTGGVKLILWAETSPLSEMVWSCKYFPHASKMPTLTHNNRLNSFIIKNAIILNTIYTCDIFNLHDTEVVIYIILVLLKRANGFNHHINIR